MRQNNFSPLLSAFLLLSIPITADISQAAAKLPVVTESQISRFNLTVKVGRTERTKAVVCYKKTPGSITRRKTQMLFSSFTVQQQSAQQRLAGTRNKKTRAKLTNDINLFKALRKAGATACVEPPYLSMRQFTGKFGLKQAQRLLEVFALGGKPGMADAYVQMGLDRTVKDLIATRPDTYIENFRAKLTCGPNVYGTTPDKCYREGNINDFYMDGFISGLNMRSIYSNNPVQMALFEFAMDQRAPGNPRVLDNCSNWMFPKYVQMVDRFVSSGDYKAFAAEFVQDPFVHGKWLSGATNHSGLLRTGNEDFGREFLELFTTGLTRPDGSPVYNDFDVYQASLAMSGMAETDVSDQNDNNICVIGFFPDLHRAGTKVLFAGTPNQMRVENAADMAKQIFIAQRDQVAYELARRLWGRFISSKGTPAAWLKLAKIITDNDFKLWPVMSRMMRSEAFYAPESNETILKNPHTLLVTFARMSGIPVSDYGSFNSNLQKVGMQLGKPPTVFGFTYQNNQLASDVYQLERFNAFVSHTLYQDLNQLKERTGFTPFKNLVAGIPLTGEPGTDLTREILKRLNMTDSLTQAQKDLLTQYINYGMTDCASNSTDPQCFIFNGKKKKLYRNAPDLGDQTSDFYRLRSAYGMVGTMPAFGTM